MLLGSYSSTRASTLKITENLSADDAQVQSMPDVSPPKWHLAHTTWFFENFVLRPYVKGFEPFHPEYHFLFNSYYKTQGAHQRRDRRGMNSRPGLNEVLKYRQSIDAQMERLLENELPAEILEIIEIGIEHEKQHQELLYTDILHILGTQPFQPALDPEAPFAQEFSGEMKWAEVEGGVREIGFDERGFCFDNETPRHETLLQPYQIASRPVTQGEFLEFIEDGAYQDPTLWLSNGWDWVLAEKREAPLYWKRTHSGWSTYSLRGLEPLRRKEPACHLSFYEADAFARWSGARLPTEMEWEDSAANGLISGIGEVWEWTSSAYRPYPGFQPWKGELGEYNAKFMSSQMVLRGGSRVSPAGHVRLTYRNFFSPSACWQFSGLRLAR